MAGRVRDGALVLLLAAPCTLGVSELRENRAWQIDANCPNQSMSIVD